MVKPTGGPRGLVVLPRAGHPQCGARIRTRAVASSRMKVSLVQGTPYCRLTPVRC